MRHISKVAVALLSGLAAVACGSSSSGSGDTADSGTASDSGAGNDSGSSSGVLPFKASNIDLSGIDLSKIVDEDVASNCEIRGSGADSCFLKAAFGTVTQSDQSKIAVYVVKSLKVEPAVHITISGLTANLPVAVVSLGDFTLLGTIDNHGQDIHATGGGFESISGQVGAGPGGGPAGTADTGGGGGSSCGQGGQGNASMGSGATPGAKTAAAGTPEIVPLQGGSSGGGAGSQGGAGGGALELVSGGTFTMAGGSYINSGGGGGGFGAPAGGGGAGGAILIEALSIKISGILAANGGGGGGAGAGLDSGGNGSPDSTPALGGPGAIPGATGSGGATIDGANAPAPSTGPGASGGGGGAGRIRLNAKNGIDVTAATMSPAATTACVTQGTVAAN